MRIAWAMAGLLVLGLTIPAAAQFRDGQEFRLVTGGVTATLLSVEVHHVQIDNTIDVAVVLRLSGPLSEGDSLVAAAEFCFRYSQQVMAGIRAEGTQTPVHVFVPLFQVGTQQTGFGFRSETCALDPPFPAELRAAVGRNFNAPL